MKKTPKILCIHEDGEEINEEANGESGNEGASNSDEDQQQWIADLINIVVDEFMFSVSLFI